jgi:hypothetical protein
LKDKIKGDKFYTDVRNYDQSDFENEDDDGQESQITHGSYHPTKDDTDVNGLVPHSNKNSYQ